MLIVIDINIIFMNFDQVIKILDSSTVAGIVTAAIAVCLGKHVYRTQKDTDRLYEAKNKIIGGLLLLREHCEAVNLGADRIVNTNLSFIRDGGKASPETFISLGFKREADEMGVILNHKIPSDVSIVESLLDIYFSHLAKSEEIWQSIMSELKSWHKFANEYFMGQTGQPDIFNTRIVNVPGFSLDKLNREIKRLSSTLMR